MSPGRWVYGGAALEGCDNGNMGADAEGERSEDPRPAGGWK